MRGPTGFPFSLFWGSLIKTEYQEKGYPNYEGDFGELSPHVATTLEDMKGTSEGLHSKRKRKKGAAFKSLGFRASDCWAAQ